MHRSAATGQAAWISCLSTLRDLSATSFGPGGRSKIIRNTKHSALTVTSISHRLFAAVRLEHPAASALLQLLTDRHAKGADGGMLTVLLASSIALAVGRSRLPPRMCASLLPELVLNCVRLVTSDAAGGLGAAAVPFHMSDLHSLLALVRTVLAPKRIALPGSDPADVDRLALLLVRALVQSLPETGAGSAGDAAEAAEARAQEGVAAARALATLPGVRQLSIIGPRVVASELVDGVLLDTWFPPLAPLPPEQESTGTRRDLLVALYTVNLEASRPEGLDAKMTVTQNGRGRAARSDGDLAAGTDATDSDAPPAGKELSGEAESLLRRFADGVARSGARVLCCQQRIAPALIRLLIARNVLPLPRVSLRHVGAVRRLSGATPLALLHPPRDADLGRLGGVRRTAMGVAKRMYTHLLPPTQPAAEGRPRPTPVVTLILCAPTRSASEELAAAVACALGTLGASLSQKRPRLVPGGGCFELLMAAQLRRDAETLLAMDASVDGGGPMRAHEGSAGHQDRGIVLNRLRRQTCNLLADTLEEVVVALAHGAPVGCEAVRELAVANSIFAENPKSGEGTPSRRFFGWDVESTRPMEVLRINADGDDDSESSSGDEDGQQEPAHRSACVEWAGVVELESEKLEAIYSAVEVACSIISVDEVITDLR